MIDALQERFWNIAPAFQERLTVAAVAVVVIALAVSGLVIAWLRRTRDAADPFVNELVLRWRSWIWISLLVLAPILLGSGWVILGVCILSMLCYGEFARLTGMRDERAINGAVIVGMVALACASFDNFFRLFAALLPLTVAVIAIASIIQDQPHGYLRRTSLGVLGFILFGYSLGYLGYFANSPTFRPVVILIILVVELNDIYAYCCGKLIGGPKAVPHTSPGKTWSGCIGAVVCTTITFCILGHYVFLGTKADHWGHLLFMGAGLSVIGQFGDLLLSSIKRDVGTKDMGTLIPGHGGVLDRFDSLVLLPPAMLHYLSLILDAPIGHEAGVVSRVFTNP